MGRAELTTSSQRLAQGRWLVWSLRAQARAGACQECPACDRWQAPGPGRGTERPPALGNPSPLRASPNPRLPEGWPPWVLSDRQKLNLLLHRNVCEVRGLNSPEVFA